MSKISASEEERIVELLREGKTLRQVAKATGRSVGSISNIAKVHGVTLDRSATENATRARKADIESKMAELAEGLMEDALRMRAQLFKPHVAFAFGGRDNEYNEHEIPEPTAADKRQLMTAIGIAVDKVHKITASDEQGLAAVDAWIRSLIPGG